MCLRKCIFKLFLSVSGQVSGVYETIDDNQENGYENPVNHVVYENELNHNPSAVQGGNLNAAFELNLKSAPTQVINVETKTARVIKVLRNMNNLTFPQINLRINLKHLIAR